MQSSPHERLLAWLSTHPGWWSGTQLAAALDVSTRTIRTYVTQLNAGDAELVESGSRGYRLASAGTTGAGIESSGRGQFTGRRPTVLRLVLASPDPLNIYDLATELDVSESTIDSDLRRLDRLATRYRVSVVRSGDSVTISGTEADKRQLMRQVLTEASSPGTLLSTTDLELAYESYDIRGIKRHVAQALAANGLHSTDYGLNPLVLDLVIAVDRISADHALDQPAAPTPAQPDPRLAGASLEITGYLAHEYGVSFDRVESDAVTMLIASKTTLLRGTTDHDIVVSHVGAGMVSLVRDILTSLNRTYLVDLIDDAFVASLALHTHNLLVRAGAGRPYPNPLAPAIRSRHPLVHELAVFYARELETATGTAIPPDEVGFIAFHLGAALEKRHAGTDVVTLSLVLPGYHGLARQIAERLIEQLGDRAIIEQFIETAEPEADQLVGDLVVTSIPVAGVHPARQITISPLLSQADLDLVDVQVRAQQRRNSWIRLAGQLHELFHDQLYRYAPPVTTRDEVLAMLCSDLVQRAAVPEDFLAQVHEREALSPTAFNDIVAIPHTLGMPAGHTSIAVAAFEQPIDWGGTPVRLVMLIAFSAKDRDLFRDTFDQLVIALTERRNVQRLLARGRTFQGFLNELGQLMLDD